MSTEGSKSGVPAAPQRALVFMWENFGPMHIDRCRAVARHFDGRRRIVGLELAGRCSTYNWGQVNAPGFERRVLFPDKEVSEIPAFLRFWMLLRACLSVGPSDFFFCHYDQLSTLAVTVVLRLLGRRVFVMNDSKFDDKPRHVFQEMLKAAFFRPYSGAMVASRRSGEYLQFLSFPPHRIAYGYDSISVSRIQNEAGSAPAPGGVEFETRHFTVVARMVPKKNHVAILKAYSVYVRSAAVPRPLHFCGSGPLEPEIKRCVTDLGLTDLVVFHGAVDSLSVNRVLANTLALLLISYEEQFGLVIPEALAMGVPVIASQNCGACDDLVRAGENGFVVEPDSPAGIAYFMNIMSSDIEIWRRMAMASLQRAEQGDVRRFVEGCESLLEIGGADVASA